MYRRQWPVCDTLPEASSIQNESYYKQLVGHLWLATDLFIMLLLLEMLVANGIFVEK